MWQRRRLANWAAIRAGVKGAYADTFALYTRAFLFTPQSPYPWDLILAPLPQFPTMAEQQLYQRAYVRTMTTQIRARAR